MIGLRFNPTNEQLVSHYLTRYLANEDLQTGDYRYLIREFDVFSTEPWNLPLMEDGKKTLNCSYFFSKRRRVSKKNENGKRSIRTVNGDDDNNLVGGFWRMSNEKPVIVKDLNNNNNETVIGYVVSLCFYTNSNKDERRKDAIKTSWLMDEFRLKGDGFQEVVLCRIKKNSKNKRASPAPVLVVQAQEKEHLPDLGFGGRGQGQEQVQEEYLVPYIDDLSFTLPELMGDCDFPALDSNEFDSHQQQATVHEDYLF